MNNSALNSAALNGSGLLEFRFEVPGPLSFRILSHNPSRRWSVLSSLVEQTIYTCTMYPPTGATLDPLTISMTSLQLRLRDGQPSYISFVATAEDGLIDAITARAGGTVEIRSGVRLRDGSEITEELVAADYDSVRYELGGRSGTVTVTAYKTETTTTSAVVPVSGVSLEAMQATGKRRIRCEPSFFIKPGYVASWNGNQMIVGMIALSVTHKTATMDITER